MLRYRLTVPALIAACFIACVHMAVAADYAVKPKWWDTLPEIEKADARGNPESQYHAMFNRVWSKSAKKLENWYLIGPFDDNGGKRYYMGYGVDAYIDSDIADGRMDTA